MPGLAFGLGGVWQGPGATKSQACGWVRAFLEAGGGRETSCHPPLLCCYFHWLF